MVDANPPDVALVERALDDLLAAIRARDLTATLACLDLDREPVVLGSELGEGARGLQAVATFFRRLYAKEGAYRFDLSRRDVRILGETAWVVAEGHVVEPGDSASKPYRLTAVFTRASSSWRMLLWSGTEPVSR